MAETHPYAVTLQQLGSIFDKEGVEPQEIADHDTFFAVSWSVAGNRREECFNKASLPRSTSPAAGEWASRLRALGRLLDRRAIDVARIVPTDGGVVISGARWGKYFTARYSAEEVVAGQVTTMTIPAFTDTVLTPLQRRLQQMSRTN